MKNSIGRTLIFPPDALLRSALELIILILLKTRILDGKTLMPERSKKSEHSLSIGILKRIYRLPST